LSVIFSENRGTLVRIMPQVRGARPTTCLRFPANAERRRRQLIRNPCRSALGCGRAADPKHDPDPKGRVGQCAWRFSEKIMLNQRLRRDGDFNQKSHRALIYQRG
jgi:hypothetical protein